ncbi:MAG: tRNA-binding protein [Candidatus Diapherotrites archaeon]
MKQKINADLFCSLDIRVGEIIQVKEFPEAKKNLYLVTVNFGDLTLKSAAGLKGIKRPEELIGLKVIGITNIVPKQIGKHISECLILAAKDGNGKPNLLKTEKDSKPGAEIF